MKKLPLILILILGGFLGAFATYPGFYLRAKALEMLGMSSQAKATYSKIAESSQGSSWANKSAQAVARIDAQNATPTPTPTALPTATPTSVPVISSTPSPQGKVLILPKTQSPAAESPAKQSPGEKRVNPSYGGPLGAYWHTKNKINDVQKQHNDDLMKQMPD